MTYAELIRENGDLQARVKDLRTRLAASEAEAVRLRQDRQNNIIAVATGKYGSYAQVVQLVEGLEDSLKESERKREEAERALALVRPFLERIANPQCGCHPKCQCLEPGSLAVFRQEAIGDATDLLALLPQENKRTNG